MKSSDIKQTFEYKRTALYNRELPVAEDFGSETPYPVILTNWDDPVSGKQFVFSTYDGTDVKHWIAIGVDGDSGTLSAWQPDGSYKRVVMEDFGEPETRSYSQSGTMPSAGGSETVDHNIDPSNILSVSIIVEVNTGEWIDPRQSLLSGVSCGISNTLNQTAITLDSVTSTLLVGKPYRLFIRYLR